MHTVTIDILNDSALNLLKDLEALRIIRVRKEKNEPGQHYYSTDLVAKYKGAMARQSLKEIDQQLNDLRNEWN